MREIKGDSDGGNVYGAEPFIRQKTRRMKRKPAVVQFLIKPLDQVNVQLYSDLLLHDMGPGLADNRPDGGANGSEWKTAPLWGTRLIRDFLGGNAFFMHDGRATSLDGAIRAHGGEADSAKSAYINLSEEDRKALIAFLESL